MSCVAGLQNAMMCAMQGVEYFDLERILQRVDSDFGAAQCHGIICGILAVDDAFSKSLWLDKMKLMDPESNLSSVQTQQCLSELFTLTRDQLYSTELSFFPLLPGDCVGLPERVRALSNWCEGFTYGLALAGLNTEVQLPEDVAEIIKDFTEISRVEIESDTDEEDELAYVELVEYVKVGVLLTCEELPNAAAPAPAE